MTTWGFFLQLLALALALALGHGLAVQGVLTGRAIGRGNVSLWRWRVVWQSYQFRHDKAFYRAAIVTV